MATYLTKVNVDVSLTTLFKNLLDTYNGEYAPKLVVSNSLTEGEGADQAEFVYYKEGTISGGPSTLSLDLYGGLTDAFGNTINAKAIKLFAIQNVTTTAGVILKIVRPATNGCPLFGADGDYIVLGPGGLFLWFDPSAAAVAITDSTDDDIDITNSHASTAASYKLMIVGTK